MAKALARKTAFLRAQGYSPEAIDALAGQFAADFGSPEAAAAQQQQTGGGVSLAGAGATTTVGDAPPPEFQAAMSSWVAANRGKMTPESYIIAFNSLAQTFNYPGRANAANVPNEVAQLNKGAPYGGIAPGERDLSQGEQITNDIANSPVGAALIGAGQANRPPHPRQPLGHRLRGSWQAVCCFRWVRLVRLRIWQSRALVMAL